MVVEQFDIPVVFIVFNRPHTTRKVFDVIKKINPKQLFIIADGPRNEAEKVLCDEVREIVSSIDSNCEVHKNFADRNLGCKQRINTGISWVFEHVDKAIFLEDDCLPDMSFFQYCKELLEKYEDNHDVVMISGDKIHPELSSGEHSYYFSSFNHIWGWATWRRVWKRHDTEMKDWPALKKTSLLSRILLGDKKAVAFWKSRLQKGYSGFTNTWDYQLQFTSWKLNGLTIIPDRNLITNIGIYDEFATHQSHGNLGYDTKSSAIGFPLIHPAVIERNTANDLKEMCLYYRLSFLENLSGIMRIIGIEPARMRKALRNFFK